MNGGSSKRTGTFVQRIWWWLLDSYRQLTACRFSFFVALIAGFVFLRVAQGTEVLRAVGEGMASGPQGYWAQLILFFAALLLWAIASWYGARTLLTIDLAKTTDSATRHFDWWQTHVPRILGIAPLLIVAGGFIVASASYAPAEGTRSWLSALAVLCVLLAVAFYFMLILRRRFIHRLPGTAFGVLVMALISAGLFLIFTVAPVRAAQNLGMGSILLLAAASWVVMGSFLVYLVLRWKFPVIGSLIVLALIFSLWNDNHAIRTSPPQRVKRADVLEAFQQWHQVVEAKDGAGAYHPLFIVATEGGGIRAAYWTAIVLGAIQDAEPSFATHLFAISGVSGGSLGATVFDALLAEPNPVACKDKAHQILSQDFLSPTLAAMLYPDLVQRLLPFPITYFDRGRALEMGWEKAWRDTMHNNRFAESFVDLWENKSREWMPALFLNGTSVENGNRIITSNLRLTNVFLDAEDAGSKLAGHKMGATEAACHIPLSTAAHMSARFTYVSPAGRFPDGTRIVDGGYFENSAATTALEIANRVRDFCSFKQIRNVDVKIIMISNDPRAPSIMIAPAKPGPEPVGPKLTESETVQGHLAGEATAPLLTLLNTRNARGTYAQKAIGREQRRFKAVVPQDPSETDSQPLTKDIVYFKLRDTHVPLPLGWMLSKRAAQTMHDQLTLNDGIIKNGEAMSEISKSLQPPRP